MRVGVCSWSLQPESPEDLIEKVTACGVRTVQLALDPLITGGWNLTETKKRLDDAGIEILSLMLQTIGEDYSSLESIKATGGLRPDEHWQANLEIAKKAADLTPELSCNLTTFHAGFMPHSYHDPEHTKLVTRIDQFAEVFGLQGGNLALETGQESAATLNEFLSACGAPNLGVNFDPANMILYSMGDPVASLIELSDRIAQIHLKDAAHAKSPGEWGEEVTIGEGEVDWQAFFSAISEASITVNTMIEREAGDSRIADIKAGLAFLEPMLNSAGASA